MGVGRCSRGLEVRKGDWILKTMESLGYGREEMLNSSRGAAVSSPIREEEAWAAVARGRADCFLRPRGDEGHFISSLIVNASTLPPSGRM